MAHGDRVTHMVDIGAWAQEGDVDAGTVATLAAATLTQSHYLDEAYASFDQVTDECVRHEDVSMHLFYIFVPLLRHGDCRE